MPRGLLQIRISQASGCWLALLICCFAALNANAQSSFGLQLCRGLQREDAEIAGTYQGHAPSGDAARRVFTLELATDRSASLTTLYIGKDEATQRGHWSRNGSEVAVTFDPVGKDQPPRPITFRHRPHELDPLHWDPNEWGRRGPPTLHRIRTKAIALVSPRDSSGFEGSGAGE